MSAKALWALCGATAVQLLSQLPQIQVRAAWCWPSSPPVCTLPTVTGGSCIRDGAAVTQLAAGENCTPSCDSGLNLTGSCSQILCPPSVPGSDNKCLGDAGVDGVPWWDHCLFGASCVGGPFSLDTNQQFGYFQCVDPSSANICGALAAATTPAPSTGPTDFEILDYGTVGVIAGIFVIGILGLLMSLCCSGPCGRLYFRPGPKQWSPANLAGVVVVVAALVAASLLPYPYKATGIAAGIGTALTMAFAFFKLGAHDVMLMTREAAWKIHAALGALTLITGIVHGVLSIIQVQDQVFTEPHFLAGLIGLVLMIVGVLPANMVHYDKFKIVHFASFFGFIFVTLHMLGHARSLGTVAAIVIAVVNAVALVLFVVQKIFVKATGKRVEVKKAELVTESGGQHLFLSLSAPNFNFQPGQWGHLQVPSLGLVNHPFTLVPGDDACNVRIFMKINRSGWTAKLAKACEAQAGAPPQMKLEGPHGRPAVPAAGMQRVVFVLGGVGITPGLSLAKAANEATGRKAPLFWSLRSLELLHRAAPLLEPHVDPASTVQLNGAGVQEGGADLPLQAKYASQDVGSWLAGVGETYAKEGVTEAMVFVCGPPGLAESAKAAVKSHAGGIPWHLHVEEFLFLPSMSMGKRPPTAPAPGAKASE